MKGILGALATSLWPAVVFSYASTDSIQDADPPQSGYLPNHNMDPNVVGGSSFGILWQQTGSSAVETWYAKPLTYTINGGREMVITASNMNNVRIYDSKNGTLIASRQLYPPFLQSDIGCGDIPNYIGVTGTPIIDPATDTIYMMAKGYKDGAASGGMPNGIYKLHALQLPSLTDAPGFPVLIDGHNADNDPARYFVGGTVLQRPSLATLNGAVIAAFGGHCDLFNYTGMLVAVSKTPGVGVVSMFAMESSPGAPTPQPMDLTVEKGGKAGIWQSGMGLAIDASRIFAVTGNGQGHANGNVPASGRLPLSTLDEVVGNFAFSSAGKITLSDYFEPYDYVNMDAGDQDLGSSGLALLDGATFKTSSVPRIGVTVGKNSKVYVLNAENLGGFKQGSGGTDNILQTITASNSVFGGAGSYPLEGGYFYFTPVGDSTYAYKFGTDASGKPFFTLAGKTPTTSAGRAGVGQPTITTNGGRPGTAILWITDVNTGLRAFKAVPDSNGVLQPITLPATPGINKFQRPAFGDGRVFVTANNKLICLGAPVNLPLTCTGPIDFGNVQTGEYSQQMVSCKANILITKVNGCTTGDKLFQCDNATLPQGQVTAGTTFTFPVTWNLTQKAINDAQGVSYGRVIPGVEGAVLNIYTTNGVAAYSTTTPISLTGTVVSSAPFLFMSPTEVDFGGLVLGGAQAEQGLTGSAVIQNIGNGTLTITGVAWQDGNVVAGPYTNVTYSGISATFAQGFSSSQFVVPGQTLAPGQSIGMPLFFNTTSTGSFAISVTVWSDGGVDTVMLAASAGNPAIASIAVSTSENGWDNSVPTAIHFGNVLAGTTVTRQIRICNTGGSVLTITKSKPPIGAQLTAVNPYGELLEGQKIDVGACAFGTVAVYAAPVQPNHPSQYINLVWVLNTDGLDALNPSQDFGVHDVQTDVTIVTRQIGPALGNGTARYQWVGCFKDTGPLGRNLQNQVNNAAQSANNTNEQCQTLCLAAGYSLAGTQYSTECWCGSNIKYPSTYQPESLNLCTFACPGDGTQSCGGDGGYMSLYADVSKFDIQAFYASLSATTSSTTATATSTSTATGTGTETVTTTPTGSGSPLNPLEPDIVSGQWQYIGCHLDNVNGAKSLKSGFTASDTMTLESCAAYCSKYNYFGTEYGRECYCGYTVGGSNTTTLRATESDCNAPCAGNSAQLCGTGNRLSVYTNLVYQEPPPSPSHVPISGIYGWIGCYTEATAGRALSAFAYADDSMTVDTCAAFCAAKGTAMMGVEYGRECYCGNALNAGSVLTDTASCGTLCKNNTLQYCGAGGRLDMYSKLAVTSTSSSTSSMATSSSSSSVVTTTGTTTDIASTSSSTSVSASSSVSTDSSSVSSSTSSSTSTTTDISTSDSSVSSMSTGVSGSTDVSSTTSTDITSTTTDLSTTSTDTSTTSDEQPTSTESSASSDSSTSTTASTTSESSTSSDPSTTTDSPSSTTDVSTSSDTQSSTSSDAATTTDSPSTTTDVSTSSDTQPSTSSDATTTSDSSTSTSDPATSSTSSSATIIDDPSSTTAPQTSTGSSTSSDVASPSIQTTSTSTSDLSASTSSSSISTSSSSTSTSSSSTSASSSSSSSSSDSSSSSSSSSSSLSSSSSSSSSSLPTTPASTSATTTSSSSSTTSTSTSTGPTATATGGYFSIGCFADRVSGHALPLLVTNSSMTPELCIAHANSVAAAAPTPTKFPYVFIEYHGECYGGTSFDFKGSAVTSLYGTKACTDWCSGSIKPYTTNGVVKYSTDLTNRCGGAKQFNLYAVSTPVVFPTTGGPVQTIKTG